MYVAYILQIIQCILIIKESEHFGKTRLGSSCCSWEWNKKENKWTRNLNTKSAIWISQSSELNAEWAAFARVSRLLSTGNLYQANARMQKRCSPKRVFQRRRRRPATIECLIANAFYRAKPMCSQRGNRSKRFNHETFHYFDTLIMYIEPELTQMRLPNSMDRITYICLLGKRNTLHKQPSCSFTSLSTRHRPMYAAMCLEVLFTLYAHATWVLLII